MSTVIRSYGSWVWPSTSWSSTSGRETVSSKPSRRICSIRTASWSSPRPDLVRVAGLGRADLDRDVAERFPVEAGLDLAARQQPALAAGERRGVDAER